MLGAVEPKFWRAFCAAADRPDWVGRQSEPLPQARLIADLAAFFKSLSLAEASGRFADADCCFSAVLDLEEALTSEQLRARGLVRREPVSGALQTLFPAYVDGEQPRVRPPLALHAAGARMSIDGSK
jgi:alpha-methylacyl-CoA racemase